MQMIFLIITITLSTGVGFFVVKDRADFIADRSQITKAEVAEQQNAYFMRALRREISIDPGGFSIPTAGNFETISPQKVDSVTFGGFRNLDIVDFVLDETGLVLAVTRSKFERGPGIGGAAGRVNQVADEYSQEDAPGDLQEIGTLDQGTIDSILENDLGSDGVLPNIITNDPNFISAKDRISRLMSGQET
jgi:hypothetical protein